MDEAQKANDQAERTRRLQERRAASGRAKPAPSTAAADTGMVSASASPRTAPGPAPRPAARRRHPAAASRILLAGLSVASFFSVGGAIALANRVPALSGSAVNGATNALGNAASSAAKAGQPSAVGAAAHTVTKGS